LNYFDVSWTLLWFITREEYKNWHRHTQRESLSDVNNLFTLEVHYVIAKNAGNKFRKANYKSIEIDA
jgi:hypothetical protein